MDKWTDGHENMLSIRPSVPVLPNKLMKKQSTPPLFFKFLSQFNLPFFRHLIENHHCRIISLCQLLYSIKP